ncbi:hypothetical protein [Actinocorallia sp. A-T 12471]|uniref:hypothetical protein n=1 Tax=Actinocorallia sp. A-T 12471 TaxID=3089813 RepID=UPI0029D12289|nr:hypothetical protein [Actinocorallia sp. A-T 12471]MDX6742813.1 hypothetical protein [Actinocorallia sp. A-T 12471]
MTVIQGVDISGDDSQNALGNTVEGDLVMQMIRIARERPKFVLSEGEVNARARTYVKARDHDLIAKALERDRVVALSGPPGAGLETTAIVCLVGLLPAAEIRLFSTDDDIEEIGLMGATGLLLRARDQEPARLRTLVESVRASQGFAVVFGTPAETRPFAEFLTPVTVQPPPALDVYRRHVTDLGREGWADWQVGAHFLRKATPSDAVRLARLVRDITAEGGDEAEVARAYKRWSDELHTWFGEHLDPLERALLIAATTVAPADDMKIYGAALSLARRLEATPTGGGLAWTPTAALQVLLKAERADDRIGFPRHGYADSVVDHVCAEYPLAQTDLVTWLGDLPTDAGLAWAEAERHRLARAFASLAVRCDAPERIASKTEEWTGGSGDNVDLAYIVLSETCLDPVVGGRIRRQLYDWSRKSRMSASLKLTVARVCEVVGQTYLSQALTRLRYLGTYGGPQIRQEVAAVAVALAERSRGTVFATALRWLRDAPALGHMDAARRVDTSLRVLSALVHGVAEARTVLEELDSVLQRADTRLHRHLQTWARRLARDHPLTVASLALYQAADADRPFRRAFGTELYLSLLAAEDVPRRAELVGLHPPAAAAVWATALQRPAAFRDTETALGVWLDTAVTHPRLSGDLVASIVTGARPSHVRREAAVALTRRWSAGAPGRRHVAESVVIRLLLPEWKRWLLFAWVWLRSSLTGRR